jgi:hypothetical protein
MVARKQRKRKDPGPRITFKGMTQVTHFLQPRPTS